jgi:hypothetical protein
MEISGGKVKEFGEKESPFGLLKEIALEKNFTVENCDEWQKTLEENLYENFASLESLNAEDWEAMDIPLQILIELKKRYVIKEKPKFTANTNQQLLKNLKQLDFSGHDRSKRYINLLDGVPATQDQVDQSFQDLSQFMKVTHSRSESINHNTLNNNNNNNSNPNISSRGRKRKGSTRSVMSTAKIDLSVNVVGREGHSTALIRTFFDNPQYSAKSSQRAEVCLRRGFEVIIFLISIQCIFSFKLKLGFYLWI